ncbi:MAG: glycosyltransferase family 4 protein, partial [Promethearchaeota archaeon]
MDELKLDVNLFTPRFFPSIAGGEFYFLKLAELLKNQYGDLLSITTSNAIDFKALKHPEGRLINKRDTNFSSYHQLPINRIIIDHNINKDSEFFQNELKKLDDLLHEVGLNIDSTILAQFLANGPNLTNYFKNQLNLSIKSDKLVKPSESVVHSTYLPYNMLVYSLIYAKSYGIKSFCTPFFHIENPRYFKEEYWKILTYFDGIIACTKVEREYLIEKGINPQKITVIPMGVDYNLYSKPVKSKTGKTKSFKNKFGIKNPFIFYCGYKNHEKGALALLKTAALTAKNDKFDYVFIGPSTTAFDFELKNARKEGARIINLSPGNMTGYFDWRKISAFQECSIFVMPSRSDAYGMVYLEAWAAGKPVIGANTPVMQEVIQHNVDGILVDFDDSQQLAKEIIKMMDNSDFRD